MLTFVSDTEAQEIIEWHRNRHHQPGEPDFAHHPYAMATPRNRGTYSGKTLAEHGRAIIEAKSADDYFDRYGFDKATRRRLTYTAVIALADAHNKRIDTRFAARQVLAGWHGNGHLLRQRSLQMDGWQYAEVVNTVQQIQGRT